MTILRVQHFGMVVKDLNHACSQFERAFGLKARDFRDDQAGGQQLDARILLGNECWLHLVQNWKPGSRVGQFLEERGEGLEHIAIETDDIEGDVARLRKIGIPVFEDTIFDRQDGYEAFVLPDQLPGLTIELIQSHDRSWVYPSEAIGKPISSVMNLIRLHHFGLVVENLQDACKRFEQVLGLSVQDFRDDQGKGMQYDARILLPNHCWLHLVQNWNPEARVNRFLQSRGQGLDHIAVQTNDIQADVNYLREQDIPVFKDEILNAADGFESFVYPDQLPGMTVELIEPHSHSWSFPEEAFPSRTD
jgi:methylmalonyl-CoA/ethylmalonyl-CoA epimerase